MSSISVCYYQISKIEIYLIKLIFDYRNDEVLYVNERNRFFLFSVSVLLYNSQLTHGRIGSYNSCMCLYSTGDVCSRLLVLFISMLLVTQ